jgi:hypothetical protein
MPREDAGCEHGSGSGYCGLCVAIGEGKLTPERAAEIAEGPKNESTFPGECDHLGYGQWSG